MNVNQSDARDVLVQAGDYAKHRWDRATIDGREIPVGASWLKVRLEPGAGARLAFPVSRYVNQPTLLLPWDRE